VLVLTVEAAANLMLLTLTRSRIGLGSFLIVTLAIALVRLLRDAALPA